MQDQPSSCLLNESTSWCTKTLETSFALLLETRVRASFSGCCATHDLQMRTSEIGIACAVISCRNTPDGQKSMAQRVSLTLHCSAVQADIWYTGLADHAAGRSEAAQQNLLETDIARGIKVRKCRQNTILVAPCLAGQPVGSPMSRDCVPMLRSLLNGSR